MWVALHYLTDFADLGLMLPLTGLIALALAALGRWREALAWSLAVGGTFAAMCGLKVAMQLWGGIAAATNLNSPSGHTAAGMVVYGGLLLLILGGQVSRLRLALLAGLLFGGFFGLTRLWLEVHTVEDVLVGGLVGLGGVLSLAWLTGLARPAAPVRTRAAIAAVALLGTLVFHGHRIGAENELQAIAAEIRAGLRS